MCKNKCFWLFSLLLVLSLPLSACSAFQTAVPASAPAAGVQVVTVAVPMAQTTTYDPCQKENLKQEIVKYTKLMNHFDQVSSIALAVPKSDITQIILDLQHKREEADQVAPACLAKLKEKEQSFMNAVIVTLTHFVAGAEKEQTQEEILASRQLRSDYEKEIADLLGIPYVTATPMPTTPPTVVPPTSTVTPVTATAKQSIYVVGGPATTYAAVGAFMTGEVVNVLGRNATSDWLKIELAGKPGVLGWIPTAAATVTGQIETLPVVTQ